jgi:ADP-heptose:LPS heptosyltransferase
VARRSGRLAAGRVADEDAHTTERRWPDVVGVSEATGSLLLGPVAPLIPQVERIAVLRANSIGDFVVALPALEALRAAYPTARITYLGEPWHARFLPGRPGPWDAVAVVPPYPGVRGTDEGTRRSPAVRAFLAEQRAARYDLAVQMHGGGGNSNPFLTALGARVSVGSQDVNAAPLDRSTRYVYYQHEVLRFLEVVALAGAAPVNLLPRLSVTDADREEAAAVLPESVQPLVAVHPGATDPRRRWPPERFAAVADALARDRSARVVLVGAGPDDAATAARICAAMRVEPENLVDRLSLAGTVGLLQRCALLLGNDSGPRHLAAAVGAATVGVYWCGNLINAGPLTRRRHRVAVSFRSACPVCGLDQGHGRCEHDPSFVADVPVEEVLGYALDLFDEALADPVVGVATG